MVKRNLYSGIATSGGFGFDVFTEDEINQIHLATLEVLEKTGFYVGTEEALDILEGGGAKVDREKKIVKFPSYLVEDCIRSAPPKIVLYGRDPRHDVVLEDKRVNFCTFGQGVSIMELDGTVRASVNADVGKAALLTDAMEEVDVCERSLTAGDAPDNVAPIHEAEVVFANTANPRSMARAMAGGPARSLKWPNTLWAGKKISENVPYVPSIVPPPVPSHLTKIVVPVS